MKRSNLKISSHISSEYKDNTPIKNKKRVQIPFDIHIGTLTVL